MKPAYQIAAFAVLVVVVILALAGYVWYSQQPSAMDREIMQVKEAIALREYELARLRLSRINRERLTTEQRMSLQIIDARLLQQSHSP